MAQIEAQFAFIAAQSPQNAAEWFDRVLDAIATLEQFPKRCALAPESGRLGFELRMFIVDGFLLLFRIDGERSVVEILHARHGRQRPVSKTDLTDPTRR